jgi:outer membrane protein assembly factor BamB
MSWTKRIQTLAVLLLACLPGIAAEVANPPAWPQWRGPARDGSAPGVDWPDSLSGLTRLWQVPLGKGYPGPIIVGDRVFVVETVDEQTVAARALDRSSGEVVWNRTWPATGNVPFFAARNGDWVRSTPAHDGEHLYVGDMTETLVALDAATGREAWRVDLPGRFGTEVPDFGFVSSPLVDGDALYVQAANSVVKLRATDGETLWRSLAGSGEIQASGAFSSPVIATLAGKRQLVVQQRHELFGVDLDTGEELWSRSIPNFRGMMILTPTVVGDSVFTSTYKGQSYLFTIRRGGQGFHVEESWSNKASAYMSSPIVFEGHVYLHLANGRLDCIDLATGESRWRSPEPMGRYWSMARSGDRILALSDAATLYVLRANPERFELLDSRSVGAEAWAHVGVSGDQLFVRELTGITAYRWQVERN